MKKKLTIPDLRKKKADGERVAMASVGDFLTASWAESAGIDVIAVGDSIGMTVYGHENTLAVTVDQMIAHCQAARRGAPNTLLLTALPYGSCATRDLALTNAFRMMKESGADAVKIQGGPEMHETIRAVAGAGIPVIGHVGLQPQLVHQYGGFRAQGRTAADALEVVRAAKSLEAAGVVGLEVEAMPEAVGRAVDEAVEAFTLFIGSGRAGTCQLLNGYDLIGSFDAFLAKFAKRYGNVGEIAMKAMAEFGDEVRSGKFPEESHAYAMQPGEQEAFEQLLSEESR